MPSIKMQSNSIPVPSVADAGKFVGVDENGSYALAQAGGNSDDVTVNVAFNSFSNGTEVITSADKTYSELADAFSANKTVKCVATYRNIGSDITEIYNASAIKAPTERSTLISFGFTSMIKSENNYYVYFCEIQFVANGTKYFYTKKCAVTSP